MKITLALALGALVIIGAVAWHGSHRASQHDLLADKNILATENILEK